MNDMDMDPEKKKLTRSSDNRMIGGVCAGIAEYLDIDTTVVRVAFALLTIFSGGSGILLYIILLFVMPNEY